MITYILRESIFTHIKMVVEYSLAPVHYITTTEGHSKCCLIFAAIIIPILGANHFPNTPNNQFFSKPQQHKQLTVSITLPYIFPAVRVRFQCHSLGSKFFKYSGYIRDISSSV